jgi:phenylacetate-CoA ligase
MQLPTPRPVFPGALWPAVPQTQGAALLAVIEQLSRSQYLSEEALAAARRPQIESLIDHAAAQVPFWQERLSAAGLDAESRRLAAPDAAEWKRRWALLPILTRAEVQSLGKSLHVRQLPAGHGGVGESVTSGSSGRPVRIIRSTLDYFYWQAFQLREHIWRERDLSGSFLSILRNEQRTNLDDTVHLQQNEDWGAPVATVWPTGPSYLLDYRAPISALIEALRDIAPDYVCTFPSLLLEILRRARQDRIPLPKLKEAVVVGEASPPELSALCREVWDAPLSSTYTAGEAGAIAYQCLEEGRWHVQAEKSIVEVLDAAGRPCAAGETGNVVLTPLHNFAMPLLRYEIGDLATVGASPCACGRQLPVLDAIPGRARDLLMLPSGDLRPPYYGHRAVMQVGAILQHQVVQTARDHICFRLVVARPLTCAEEQHVIAVATEALGGGLRVTIEYVDEITRGPNGKFAEFVIRRAKTGHSSAPKTGHHVGGTGWKDRLIRSCWQGVRSGCSGLIGCIIGVFGWFRPAIAGRRAGRFWVVGRLGCGLRIIAEPVPQAVASALEGDDLGVVKEAVEDGRGARHIAQELAPVFEWPVAGHDSASGLVAAHDDLEQVFAAPLGQLFHSHVVDDQEVRTKVAGERGIVIAEGFFVEEVSYDVEYGTIENGAALLDGGVADRLGEVGLAGAWWPHEEDVSGVV